MGFYLVLFSSVVSAFWFVGFENSAKPELSQENPRASRAEPGWIFFMKLGASSGGALKIRS